MNPIDMKRKIIKIIEDECKSFTNLEFFIYEYSYSSKDSNISFKSYIGDFKFDTSFIASKPDMAKIAIQKELLIWKEENKISM